MYIKEVQIVYKVVSSELLLTAWKHIDYGVKQKLIETEVFTVYVGGLVIH